ncbi:hypothetical protein [Brucella intermedia]|nr:hypothetical protein [Brucella intermedia]
MSLAPDFARVSAPHHPPPNGRMGSARADRGADVLSGGSAVGLLGKRPAT